jgi:hypothetical protein
VGNNKDPNQKQPGEKEPGRFHYNPGNMSGKTIGTHKRGSVQSNADDPAAATNENQNNGPRDS